MKPQCEKCRFWESSDKKTPAGYKMGFCRRYPPSELNHQGDSPFKHNYPLTPDYFWCGEYQQASK